MAQKKPLGAGNPDNASDKLEGIVREKIAADPQLRQSQIVVSADVTRNAVTLSGTVGSEELRRRAVELARGAQAGVVVIDRMQVKAAASSDARRQRKTNHA